MVWNPFARGKPKDGGATHDAFGKNVAVAKPSFALASQQQIPVVQVPMGKVNGGGQSLSPPPPGYPSVSTPGLPGLRPHQSVQSPVQNNWVPLAPPSPPPQHPASPPRSMPPGRFVAPTQQQASPPRSMSPGRFVASTRQLSSFSPPSESNWNQVASMKQVISRPPHPPMPPQVRMPHREIYTAQMSQPEQSPQRVVSRQVEEPYVPPPWKTNGSWVVHRPDNMRRSNRETARDWQAVQPRGSTNGGRAGDPRFLVPPVEVTTPGQMPPNVFVSPRTRNAPPQIVPKLDHPLSLADTPDLPNAYGHQALENMPPFPVKWLDPTPIIEFFSGATQAPVLEALRAPPVTRHDIGVELGLRVARDVDEWTVTHIVPGGAAAETYSIDLGDILKNCNGVSLKGSNEEQTAHILGGPAGTQAVLLVRKRASRETYTIFIKRRGKDGARAHTYEAPKERIMYDMPQMHYENRVLKQSLAPTPTIQLQPSNWDVRQSVSWASPRPFTSGLIKTQGVLECEILEAKNLPTKDLLGMPPDTYVQVTLQGQTQKSKTMFKTSSPIWDEKLVISVYDLEEVRRRQHIKGSDQLCIEAFSPNTFGAPHLLGTVTFPLMDLVAGLESRGIGEGWYEFQNVQGSNAQIVKGVNGEVAQIYVRLGYTKAK